MNRNTAKYLLNHMPERESMEKGAKTSSEIMKIGATFGNGIISGAVFAIATAFPWVGIPLKICTALSSWGLQYYLTKKTDEAFDDLATAEMNAYDLAMDHLLAMSIDE